MFQGTRRLIVNPTSGTGDHLAYVRRRVEARGFDVVETEAAGDGVTLALEAVRDGVTELAVCGGDGTINEVLRGLAAADAMGEVTLGVVPAGTANLLAGHVDIPDIDAGIEAIDTGEVRTVDVGFADGQPFLVSCIAGLPAEASTAASGELKTRFGTLAFLVTGAQEALEFDPLDIELEAVAADGTETHWAGQALCVLVGNARRFVGEGGPGNMEDGLFDVAVVERMPPGNVVAEAFAHRVLGRDTEGVTHVRTDDLEIRSRADAATPITFSRDGELSEHDHLELRVDPHALELRVGDGYEPAPVDPSAPGSDTEGV